jgi:cation:H+ antiporter
VTAGSAALAGAPQLAVGGLLGSNMANMAILAFVDLISRRRVWPAVELGHARVASVAIALTALAVLFIAMPTMPRIGWIGLDTVTIAVVYGAALAWFRRARAPITNLALEEVPAPMGWTRSRRPRTGIRPAALRFAAAAIGVLIVGPFVTITSKGIADTSGLGETFVGVAFLAIATSLPELVASIAAVRMGAYDLAVGNLFGSNAMNMALLLLVDAAYRPGALLPAVSVGVEVAAGIGAILLTALALAAVVHGEQVRLRRLEPDAALLLITYGGLLIALSTLPD